MNYKKEKTAMYIIVYYWFLEPTGQSCGAKLEPWRPSHERTWWVGQYLVRVICEWVDPCTCTKSDPRASNAYYFSLPVVFLLRQHPSTFIDRKSSNLLPRVRTYSIREYPRISLYSWRKGTKKIFNGKPLLSFGENRDTIIYISKIPCWEGVNHFP